MRSVLCKFFIGTAVGGGNSGGYQPHPLCQSVCVCSCVHAQVQVCVCVQAEFSKKQEMKNKKVSVVYWRHVHVQGRIRKRSKQPRRSDGVCVAVCVWLSPNWTISRVQFSVEIIPLFISMFCRTAGIERERKRQKEREPRDDFLESVWGIRNDGN